jgi:hypothetical protein
VQLATCAAPQRLGGGGRDDRLVLSIRLRLGRRVRPARRPTAWLAAFGRRSLFPLYQTKRRARTIGEANEASTAATVPTRANLAALRAELAEQERLGGRAAAGQQPAPVGTQGHAVRP